MSTMAEVQGWKLSGHHRSFRVEKVENGYVLHAAYAREEEDHTGRKVWRQHDRQFVAADQSGLFTMIRDYLNLESSQLREGADAQG